jgi:flavin-dependent dehydrogenase
MKSEKVDVLVIGAGPSGTVSASMVNQSGLKVKIVEKQKFPRFVIGESLLPRCMEALDAAGFIEAIQKKGFQQKSGAKFKRGSELCDFNFSDQFSKGWTWTWQVQRADFDMLLAEEVQKMGVPVDFETEVTGITFNGTDSVTTVKNNAGEESQIEARFIIDASGYGRVIPRLFNLDRPSNLPPRKTLFAHVKDTRRNDYEEPNRITVVSHAPGVWIWIIPFINGVTSVGFVGDPGFFENFSGSPEEKYRAMLASEENTNVRFKDVELVFEPKTIEGWSVTTDKFYGDGFVLTGNVTEFLDPIFSSGVTLATVSGHRAGLLASRQLKGESINWEKEFTEPTMQGVNVFRTYVMAWYDGSLPNIFYAPNPNPEIKKMICSVLAGYVWDLENPYVRKHNRALKTLNELIQLEAQSRGEAIRN